VKRLRSRGNREGRLVRERVEELTRLGMEAQRANVQAQAELRKGLLDGMGCVVVIDSGSPRGVSEALRCCRPSDSALRHDLGDRGPDSRRNRIVTGHEKRVVHAGLSGSVAAPACKRTI
jgi:hypothetical protein